MYLKGIIHTRVEAILSFPCVPIFELHYQQDFVYNARVMAVLHIPCVYVRIQMHIGLFDYLSDNKIEDVHEYMLD